MYLCKADSEKSFIFKRLAEKVLTVIGRHVSPLLPGYHGSRRICYTGYHRMYTFGDKCYNYTERTTYVCRILHIHSYYVIQFTMSSVVSGTK
jgi:hypothetical protein